MNIFFDLDGTLLDSRQRLYQLFQELVVDSKFSFDDYWELKRNKISHKQILLNQFKYTEKKYLEFEEEWMSKIELPEYLDKDIPFEGVTLFLENVKQNHCLYLVTARQSKILAENQIKKLGWENIFVEILVTLQKQEKHQLISDNVIVNSEDWLIGDTGKDIQTGKLLGIKTAAVLSGFLNEKQLLYYEPNIILDYVTHFNTTLNNGRF